MIIDPISDMLTRIRNANLLYKHKVFIPNSRIKMKIVKILLKYGFIKRAIILIDKNKSYAYNKNKLDKKKRIYKKIICVFLKYGPNNEKAIQGLERISKPSLRVFKSYKNFPRRKNFGIVIVSTSKGILTTFEAKKLKVGGEVLARVW